MVKIAGFNKLKRTLQQASRAAQELDGKLATLQFDPSDPSSVEAAIAEARLVIDNRLGSWYGNPFVDQIADGAKATFEEQIFSKVEEYKLANPETPSTDPHSISGVLERIRNTIGDLRRADYQTFDRHAERLARLLDADALREIVTELTEGLNLEAWLSAGESTRGGMVGGAKLRWPESKKEQLGLTILLARQFAGDSRKALNFAYEFYYNGKKITPNLQHMVSQVFVPFERDFSAYVTQRTGKGVAGEPIEQQEKYPRRIFIVHGHDGEARESVARFLEGLAFEVIILHEQANRGRTVIEKFEEHADVGFAVVLLTPDDVGSAATDGATKSRARQNVILELGYFLGRLSRERVVALRKGDVEIPSDILGVVYTPLDEAGAWRLALARELHAADYEIDWNVVMPRAKK